MNHIMKTNLSFLPALLGLLAIAAAFTPTPAGAENVVPPPHEAFIGVLRKTPSGEFHLEIDESAGKPQTYAIDAAGAILIDDQITGQAAQRGNILVKAIGRQEQGILHVTGIEEYQEFVGWLSTRKHHNAGHQPNQLNQEALKTEASAAPEFGLETGDGDRATTFYAFDAAGQKEAAALVKSVPEAGGGLHVLVNGAVRDETIQVSRILRERSFTGYIVTNSFIAEDRPLKDVTRDYLLDSGHATSGYGYVVNSCGGYEYFPFYHDGQARIRELVTRSTKADHIKFIVQGFDFWRGRTTRITSAAEDLSAEAPAVETTVHGLISTRSFYLQNRLQFSKSPFSITRDSLLTPASAAAGYGIAYKPCCRFGFYRTDDAGHAQLASLVKNSTTPANIKVIAKGTLDLDFFKLISVEEDTGAGPAASYSLKGRVVNVLTEESSLLIKHEAIPGFMAAMTMSFRVEPKILKIAKKGQTVTATLRVKNDDYWLEEVQLQP